MEQLNCRLQIKTVTEAGTFVGLASVFSNVDLGGDVVAPGAFTRTLQAKGNEVPVLYQHDLRQPIGLGRLTETHAGLQIEGQLVLSVTKAREAYDLMKAKVLKGLSIGYDTVKFNIKDGVRHLTELKLFEVSLVTIPMNELATVSAVKATRPLPASSIIELRDAIRSCREKWGSNG